MLKNLRLNSLHLCFKIFDKNWQSSIYLLTILNVNYNMLIFSIYLRFCIYLMICSFKNFETVYIVYINYLYPNFVDSFLFSYHQAINRRYVFHQTMTIINYATFQINLKLVAIVQNWYKIHINSNKLASNSLLLSLLML